MEVTKIAKEMVNELMKQMGYKEDEFVSMVIPDDDDDVRDVLVKIIADSDETILKVFTQEGSIYGYNGNMIFLDGEYIQ